MPAKLCAPGDETKRVARVCDSSHVEREVRVAESREKQPCGFALKRASTIASLPTIITCAVRAVCIEEVSITAELGLTRVLGGMDVSVAEN